MGALHDPGEDPARSETVPRGNAGPVFENGKVSEVDDSTGDTATQGPHLQDIATAVFVAALTAGFVGSSLDTLAARAIDIAAGADPAKYKSRIAFASGIREVDWRFGAPPRGRSYRERRHFAGLILAVSKATLAEMPRCDAERVIFAALSQAVEARDA